RPGRRPRPTGGVRRGPAWAGSATSRPRTRLPADGSPMGGEGFTRSCRTPSGVSVAVGIVAFPTVPRLASRREKSIMSKLPWIGRSRTRPVAARPGRRRATARPALEALEDRCLLSPSTYAQRVAFPNGSVSGTAVAVQPDGKAVVAGTFTPSSGGTVHDF